jgi:thioesterase domain-containing protein
MVAFEMAEQLQRQGKKVALLALCECWTQDSRPPTPGTSSAYRLWQKVNYHFHRTQRIGAKQELTKLLGSLRNKTQEVVWRNQSSPLTRSQQGHRAAVYEALRRYVPQAYSGRITVVRCAERVPWQEYDPLYGWGKIATDGVEAYEIPGSHAGIYREPNIKMLVKTLNDVLHKAQATTKSERRVLDDPSMPPEPIASNHVGGLEEIRL